MKKFSCILLLILFTGCGGVRQQIDIASLEKWTGKWRGQGLRENRLDPLQTWTLDLSLKNGRLAGVMDDALGEMRKQKLRDVRLVDQVLYFNLGFETSRGLQVEYQHEVRISGDKMLSLFQGQEGGKSFVGKWEAKRVYESGAATQ
ncbi:MAG: hypothetical protein ACREOO_13705 [bacterium]